MEVWKSVQDFSSYEVSNLGNVRNAQTGVNRKHYISHDGYCYMTLCKNTKKHSTKVHRLVAAAFLQNTDNKPQIDHIDGNKQNNRVENLRWATSLENMNAYRPLSTKNTSGYPNIHYCSKRNKFCFQKSINGKNTNLGRFDTLAEALKAKEEYGLPK